VALVPALDLRDGDTVELSDPFVEGLILFYRKVKGGPMNAVWYMHHPLGSWRIIGQQQEIGDAWNANPAEARTIARAWRSQGNSFVQ
jgi:hypothetical protein